MNRNEKKSSMRFANWVSKNRKMISGGYAPVTPPIDPLENSNGIPDFKQLSEEDGVKTSVIYVLKHS